MVLYDVTGRSASERSPSCAIIIWRDSGSPMPDPLFFVVKNGTNTSRATSGFIGQPSLLTSMSGMVILLSEAYVHAVRSRLHSVLRQICHHLPQHVLVGTNSDVVLYVAAKPEVGVHGAHAAEERLKAYVGNDSLLELRYLAITVHEDVQRSAGVVYGSDALLQRCALDGRAVHISLAYA